MWEGERRGFTLENEIMEFGAKGDFNNAMPLDMLFICIPMFIVSVTTLDFPKINVTKLCSNFAAI